MDIRESVTDSSGGGTAASKPPDPTGGWLAEMATGIHALGREVANLRTDLAQFRQESIARQNSLWERTDAAARHVGCLLIVILLPSLLTLLAWLVVLGYLGGSASSLVHSVR